MELAKDGYAIPIFFASGGKMKAKSRVLTQGAIIAALYAVLTHAQNLLIPGSATWAIQMRKNTTEMF